MPLYSCTFCCNRWVYSTPLNGRQKKAAHYKACSGYHLLNYLRFGVDRSDKEVEERVQALTRIKRDRCLSLEEIGYESEDTVVFELDNNDSWEHAEHGVHPCDNSKIILQFAYMSKIDYLSNQVMRIGSVIGSVSGLRKSANWEDYVLLNSLSDALKLSPLDGDKILQCFGEMLRRHEVDLHIPRSFRTIKDCIKRIHCDSYSQRLIDTSHKDYLGATGSFLNPIDLLAEWLLTIGDEDIIFEPEITVNQQSGELYTLIYTYIYLYIRIYKYI
jgi:hypothetical protein